MRPEDPIYTNSKQHINYTSDPLVSLQAYEWNMRILTLTLNSLRRKALMRPDPPPLLCTETGCFDGNEANS